MLIAMIGSLVVGCVVYVALCVALCKYLGGYKR